MKIALVQQNVLAGCVKHNFNNALKLITTAKENGAGTVILPAMCLSGSLVGDKWLDGDFLMRIDIFTRKLISASQDITLVFGSISDKQSCAYVCKDGNLLEKYRSGAECACSFKIQAGEKQLKVEIDALPWTTHKKHAWGDSPAVYVNCCGIQNTGKNFFAFAGGSYFYNGKNVFETKLAPFSEGILFGSIEDGELSSVSGSPLQRSALSNTDMQMLSMQRAYKGIDELLGYEPKFIFGLSGGIDSAVSCAMAVKALGKERVIAYNFPSENNTQKTKDAAQELASNLGIEYNVVPITDIQREVEKSLGEFPAIVRENIQAKIRGTDLLSNFAQIHRGVFTCNGNKLEAALGYCTLYGDTDGVFAPLGDLNKMEVYDIARKTPEIPKQLIPSEELIFEDWQIYPSAELAGGQRDPMKFGYHDLLLTRVMGEHLTRSMIVELYDSGELFSYLGLSSHLFEHYGLANREVFLKDLEWFLSRFHSMAFKRMQMPPVLVMSDSAFGSGYRESLLY